MSLFASLNVAVSSINAINTAVRTVSDNVANANTENYNQRKAVFESLEFGGAQIAEVLRSVNEGLFRDSIRQTSLAKGAEVRDQLYTEIDQLLGTASGRTPLSEAFEDFSTAWKAFEATPEVAAAAADVIRSGQDIVRELERISVGLDEIESRVLDNIDDQVGDLNQSLATIDRLNADIVAGKAVGRDVSALENQRASEIERVSEIIEVRAVTRSDGSIALNTPTGLSLADRSGSTFTWDAATRTLTKVGTPSTDLVGDGRLPDGSLLANINFIRTDSTAVSDPGLGVGALEKLRNQLDELAFSLADDSTGRATGTAILTDFPTDVTDANGGPVTDTNTLIFTSAGGTALGTITIESGTIDTPEEIVAAINTTVTNVRARIDSQGRLQILSDAGDIAIGGTARTEIGLPASITADTTDTFSFAYKAESASGTVDISSSTDLVGDGIITDGAEFDIGVNGAGPFTITINSGDSAQDLLDKINGDADSVGISGAYARFTEGGGLEITSTQGQLTITDGTDTPLADLGFTFNGGANVAIDGTPAASQSGDFFVAPAGLTPQDVNRSNLGVAIPLANGTETLKFNTTTNVIGALTDTSRQIVNSGLSLTATSYAGLAGGFLTNTVGQAEQAERLSINSEALRADIKQRLRDEVGVNIDEELARLTVLQNSFAANARVIDTINRMFDALEAAVR